MFIEGVEALDEDRDDDGEREHDQDVGQRKGMGEERMPAGVRMRSPNDALGEDEVDDKKQDHASRYKDLRRHGNLNLGWPRRPHDSHHAGGDARHAEAEHHPGHDEFMSSPHIQLKYRHVSDGAEHKEEEEDGGDGDIETDGRCAAETRSRRRIRWTWRHRWSLRASQSTLPLLLHLDRHQPNLPVLKSAGYPFRWDSWLKESILLIRIESWVTKKRCMRRIYDG